MWEFDSFHVAACYKARIGELQDPPIPLGQITHPRVTTSSDTLLWIIPTRTAFRGHTVSRKFPILLEYCTVI